MKLILSRLFFTERSTCGELFLDGQIQRLCYTLELPMKDGQPGSAVLPGIYPIELAPSPKFLHSGDFWVQKYAHQMPHILIPHRSLIMFHWGNAPQDTDGCILVGLTHDLDVIGESRAAFERLFAVIEESTKECFVEIQGGLPMKNGPESAIDEADA